MKTMKIYGPPGTGKTTTLITTLGKLLSRGYHPSQIAFLSHTKAAAEEARDRIAQQFDGFELSKDFKWFRTIHSACCSKLGIGMHEIWGSADTKRFSKERGWPCKGIVDMDRLLDAPEGDLNYDIVLNARSNASHWMVPVEEAIAKMPDNPALGSWRRMLDDYQSFKDEIGKIDFVDMLEMVHDKGTLGVKVLMVDECQDLSERQWKIIKEWSQDVDYLYLAGDDDQAIYAFMGASEYGFLDHPCDKEHVLTKSYRCPKAIGALAEKIIGTIKHRREKNVEWREDEGVVVRTGADWDALPWKQWAEGDKSVMVLVRHRKQGASLSYKLIDRSIPHTLTGNSVTRGRRAERVKVYLSMRQGAEYTGPKIADMMKAMGDTKAAAEVRKVTAKFHGRKFTRDDFPEFNWDNNHWPRMLAKFESERRNLETLRRLINIYGLDIIGKELPIDISTYHGSKGREADIVVLLTDCFGTAWEEQLRNPAVETRLCFVGLTRAKEKVIILLPTTDMYMRALVEN